MTKHASLGLIFVPAALAAGLIAGFYWHTPIARMLGASATKADASAQAPAQVWTCSMHPQVREDKPGLCPICHMQLTPVKVGAPAAPQHAHADRKIKYWTDPMMSPPYVSDSPGKSPMGMDLVPVYEEAPGAELAIDPTVVQNMGIRVAPVEEGPLVRTVRAAGYLVEAEPNILDINLRVSGWVRRVHITEEGQHVEAGAPLFDLYSPDLQLAVEELISARRAGASEQGILSSASKKLELLGLDRTQVESLSKLDHAPEVITFNAPITGHITEKLIVQGAAVKSGDRVIRIVDHSMLWLDAQVFEKDLPFIKVGTKATAAIVSRPRNTYLGQITFIHPHVDPMTRAATARLEVRNAGLALKPGMYATVGMEAEISERAVLVPREAVIDSGDSQVVFVAKSVGKFEPRRVRLGVWADGGNIQVLSGLAAGDTVVTSGQFLLDSESRLQEAIAKYANQKAEPPAGSSTPKGPQLPHSPATGPDIARLDDVFREYLKLAQVLGAERPQDTPVNAADLIAKADALRSGTQNQPLAKATTAVSEAAALMKGLATERQRAAFKKLSEAMITLSDVSAPSGALGETLYIMECPMAPGRWIQDNDELANPYYATDMKQCGNVNRTFKTLGAKP